MRFGIGGGNAMKCKVPGCGGDASARGYCFLHYQRGRKVGSFDLAAVKARDELLSERRTASERRIVPDFGPANLKRMLAIERDAYEAAVTVEARLRIRKRIAELEAMRAEKGEEGKC